MTASTPIKGVLAGLAAIAIAGAAIAQSTPPDPAAKDPAVGAGQQSSQTTPMGSTGTPNTAAGSTSSGGSSTPSTAAGSGSSTDTSTSGSTMGASGSTTTTTTTDTTTTDTTVANKKRTVRADRN